METPRKSENTRKATREDSKPSYSTKTTNKSANKGEENIASEHKAKNGHDSNIKTTKDEPNIKTVNSNTRIAANDTRIVKDDVKIRNYDTKSFNNNTRISNDNPKIFNDTKISSDSKTSNDTMSSNDNPRIAANDNIKTGKHDSNIKQSKEDYNTKFNNQLTRDDFRKKKSVEFMNPGLEKIQNDEKQLQNNMQNLKLSVEADKVLSEELLIHKDVDWSIFKISNNMINILKSAGYNFPSPVQYKTIPDILEGSDVLVKAKNGSGKTLSYLIPAVERVKKDNMDLQVIIITPVRELALQIAKFARILCKDLGIKSTPLIGGTNIEEDIIRISMGVHILIATPGRLHDILKRNLCTIGKNPLIVLDEADKLLDSSFFKDIYEMMKLIPEKKQMCLFSATFPVSTKSFISVNMKNPKMIWASKDHALTNVSLLYAKVNPEDRLNCLMSLLSALDIIQCIVYVNESSKTEFIARKITEMGLSCYFINHNLSQDERNEIVHSFSKNKTKVLVSTDLTTRGLDVKNVNVVINYGFPRSSETFLHRAGRAGRFGTLGCCISLISANMVDQIESYEAFVGSPIVLCTPSELKKFCKN